MRRQRVSLQIVLGVHNATTHAAAKLDAGRRSSFGTDRNSAVAYHGTCVSGMTVGLFVLYSVIFYCVVQGKW